MQPGLIAYLNAKSLPPLQPPEIAVAVEAGAGVDPELKAGANKPVAPKDPGTDPAPHHPTHAKPHPGTPLWSPDQAPARARAGGEVEDHPTPGREVLPPHSAQKSKLLSRLFALRNPNKRKSDLALHPSDKNSKML